MITNIIGSMYFFIENFQESENNNLKLGYFQCATYNCRGFGCNDCGKVSITKLDIKNHIVSGTFEFSGRCSSLTIDESGKEGLLYTGDSIVNITNGRFDIKLDIYDKYN